MLDTCINMVSYYSPLILLTIRFHTQSRFVGVVLLAVVDYGPLILLTVHVRTQSHIVGVVLLAVVDYMLLT